MASNKNQQSASMAHWLRIGQKHCSLKIPSPKIRSCQQFHPRSLGLQVKALLLSACLFSTITSFQVWAAYLAKSRALLMDCTMAAMAQVVGGCAIWEGLRPKASGCLNVFPQISSTWCELWFTSMQRKNICEKKVLGPWNLFRFMVFHLKIRVEFRR